VQDPETKERVGVVPGELRPRDLKAGRHVAVSPGAISRFLARFEDVCSHLSRTDAILGAAAAHHRLVWIHPFLDGNGRVARLMSHAMLLETLDTGAVWSVARGLARNVDTYKSRLADCDGPRRNDLDGRGTLSEEALARFANFFLSVCIDQVTFMEALMQPDKLRTRILSWVEEEIKLGALPAKSGNILEAILYRGELPRADAATAVGATDRHARRRLELTFPAPDARYALDREVVVFWGQDGETRIRCEVNEEALDDHFEGHRKDELKAFLAHQRAIEEIARRNYMAGRLERDGSVLIHTNEL
jgi:Fic family protein